MLQVPAASLSSPYIAAPPSDNFTCSGGLMFLAKQQGLLFWFVFDNQGFLCLIVQVVIHIAIKSREL